MMSEKNKKVLSLTALLVLLIVIVVLFFAWGKKTGEKVTLENLENNESEETLSSEEGATEVVGPDLTIQAEEIALKTLIESSVVAAPGTSLISPDNKVINSQGEATKTDVPQGSSLAPIQSGPIAISELSSNNTYQIAVSKTQFSPSEFKVKANEPITLSLTSTDTNHNIVFDDPFLEAVSLSVASGETRAITFMAPPPGHYTFYCNVGGDRIGHASRGEVGVMIAE